MSARARTPVSEALLCSTLVNKALPCTLSAEEFDLVWTLAAAHSVDLLLAAILRRDDRMPLQVREEAAKRLAAAKLLEHLRHTEVQRVLTALGTAEALILKGAALAYTIYPEPHLRPRVDVDLFVSHHVVSAVDRALLACGYERQPAAALADWERAYLRIDAKGLSHYVDLHWRMANPHPFADVLPFDEAWRASISVPALGLRARTLGHADALLLACVHRMAHHHDSPSLLWLWDIHLLAERLGADAWETLVRTAEQTRMRAVTRRGLELAHARFGTHVPAGVVKRLIAADREAAAQFVGGTRLIDIAVIDLAAMDSWRERLTFLRINLFPPRAHIRATYPRWPAFLVPIAYVHRFIRGTAKWLRRPPAAGMVV